MSKLYRIKDSKIDKKGLYAKKDIAPGTRIIQYIGKLITKKQTENNDKFDNDKDILKLKLWLNYYLNHSLYPVLMKKNKFWECSNQEVIFPAEIKTS